MFDEDFEIWNTSEKVFNPYLAMSVRARPFQLYEPFAEILFSKPAVASSNIYFIAEGTKVRFISEKTTVSRDGTIEVFFLIANKRLMKRKASLPKLFLDEEELRGFKSAIIGVKGQEDYQKEVIRRKTSLLTGISFNNTKSNGNVLVVNLFSTHWSGELPMLAHNLLDLQNIHVGDSPKVLYIGQSKQIRRRTSAHEKIQRALSEVSDDRDIYVYFFTFVTQEIFMNRPDEMIKLLNDPDAGRIEDEGQLNLVEMALINYFKPKYNTTFVSSAILLNQQVEHLLRANGFTQMALEISFDDPLWCFGSDHISPKQNHIIIHRLSEK